MFEYKITEPILDTKIGVALYNKIFRKQHLVFSNYKDLNNLYKNIRLSNV